MQDISRCFGALFHHTLRETNMMADALAKGGVFHTSLFFFFYVKLIFCFLFVGGFLLLSFVLGVFFCFSPFGAIKFTDVKKHSKKRKEYSKDENVEMDAW